MSDRNHNARRAISAAIGSEASRSEGLLPIRFGLQVHTNEDAHTAQRAQPRASPTSHHPPLMASSQQPTTAALAGRSVAAEQKKAAAAAKNNAGAGSSAADLHAAALALSLSNGPPTSVKLDGLAMTKFIKHSKDAHPAPATGLLLGLDLQGALEVTNVFGLPRNALRGDDSSDDSQRGGANAAAAAPPAAGNASSAATRHITSALSLLSSVNADANPVGIYVSSFLGFGAAFTTQVLEGLKVVGSLIDKESGATSAKGGDGLEKAVVLVHDLAQSAQGNTVIKAFRLSSEFVAAYKANKFTSKGCVARRDGEH